MSSAITSEPFGETKDGAAITRYTLSNSKGMNVKILNYGAILHAVNVPDKDGKIGDVTLGFDYIKGYELDNLYLGGIIGRVANKIAGGQFTLDDKTYNLDVNNKPNASHGGAAGFDKKIWKHEVKDDSLVLDYTSPDGEEHYPGELKLTVTYKLDEDNALSIHYKATTNKATPVNFTSHAYYNLAGHAAGHITDHVASLKADKYLPLDENNIPFGDLQSVEGTEYDMRKPVLLGERIKNVPGGVGFDTCYSLDHDCSLKTVGRLEHEPSGRFMEVSTTEPGMQLYTSFYLDVASGKGGAKYGQFSAVCFEAQHFPNSVNQPNFPNTILRPGETYSQKTVYKFGML